MRIWVLRGGVMLVHLFPSPSSVVIKDFGCLYSYLFNVKILEQCAKASVCHFTVSLILSSTARKVATIPLTL